MKIRLLPFVFYGILSPVLISAQEGKDSFPPFLKDSLKSGDVVFQSSYGRQGVAIQMATHSAFNHCGMVYKESNQWYVYEAVQPVRKVLLTDWVAQGEGNKIVVSRYLNADSSYFKDSLYKLVKQMGKYVGRNYDLLFKWDDKQLYCSELVWKLYKNALGIELCSLRRFGDYDLSNPLVKRIIKERFGKEDPKEQLVVAPEDLYQSSLLKVVFTNFEKE